MTALKTERLTLRPLAPADAEAYAALRFHPDVVRWLPAVPGEPIDVVRGSIERFAAGWQQRRYAPWGCFWAPG
jgi:RimJ/RimL family protein N-acetyltransferase